MYNTESNLIIYVLTDENHYYRKYDSYEEFILNTRYDFVYDSVGNSFDHLKPNGYVVDFGRPYSCYSYYKYVVKDNYGTLYYRDAILADIKKVHAEDAKIDNCIYISSPFFTRAEYVTHHCIFRFDPVPNSGWGKGGRSRKAQRHVQERRYADDDKLIFEETGYRIRIRGRRKRANLPEPWDHERQHRRYKNWKKHRKHQWK